MCDHEGGHPHANVNRPSPLCLTKGILLFAVVYARLGGPKASGMPHVSITNLSVVTETCNSVQIYMNAGELNSKALTQIALQILYSDSENTFLL